jgi:hypothetical protein
MKSVWYGRLVLVSFFALVAFARPVSAQTVLELKNATSTSVHVIVKFPSSSTFGCGPLGAHQLVVKDVTVNPPVTIPVATIKHVPGLAYFALGHKHRVQIQPRSPLTCLQSLAFSFAALPQCPCGTKVPAGFNSLCSSIDHPFGGGANLTNGVNFAEVTLNVPSGDQETVDISCNKGANSIINIALPGTGWTGTTTSITNASVDILDQIDNNCSINGVFPYNLDNCNSNVNSNPCYGEPFCTTYPDFCQIQRSGSGGKVTVTYMGPS